MLQDFPDSAYQPKVQLPFFTPPGECPRKIEIERSVYLIVFLFIKVICSFNGSNYNDRYFGQHYKSRMNYDSLVMLPMCEVLLMYLCAYSLSVQLCCAILVSMSFMFHMMCTTMFVLFFDACSVSVVEW